MKWIKKITGMKKFLLYAVAIILLNLAGTTLFFRWDLTKGKVYSLSEASKKAVSTLSEPLTVKVFFTKNLPAPYNGIERYLNDLLEEYSLSGNRYFNYQFFDVSSEGNAEAKKNQALAEDYGIQPVEVRKIEEDQVKFQRAYMGLALIHGDMEMTIPDITSTDGLEYRITSTIQKMNDRVSALLRMKGKIDVNLFLSSSLNAVGPYMDLHNLSSVPTMVEKIVGKLNRKNYGKLAFHRIDPSLNNDYAKEAESNQILSLTWESFTDRRGHSIKAGKAYAGIIISAGDKREKIDLIKAYRLPLFGTQYRLAEKGELEKSIDDSIENLANVNKEIGYLSGHGTLPLSQGTSPHMQRNPDSLSAFNRLVSQQYQLKEVRLGQEEIPEGLPLLIIAGPKEKFSEYELYQIDQHLMKGRNLAIFLDPFREVRAQGSEHAMGGLNQPVSYLPLDTGLRKLLSHYGLNAKISYVLDKKCFTSHFQGRFGGGLKSIYYAPLIGGNQINETLPYLKNLRELILVKTSPLSLDESIIDKNGIKASRLLTSSEEAWEMNGKVNLNPLFLNPPVSKDQFSRADLAYVLEGRFPSYFADREIPLKKEQKKGDEKQKGIDSSKITGSGKIIKRGAPAKIFLIGTSEILTDRVLSGEGKSPNEMFVLNVIDYLNGRIDNALMRAKTQKLNPLADLTPSTRMVVKTANMGGLPILVALSGLVVWFRRKARKKAIEKRFKHIER